MPLSHRRRNGKSKSMWASMMVAAVAAALGVANRYTQAATLTWDSDANAGNGATDGGGTWQSNYVTSPAAPANWFNSGTDTTWAQPVNGFTAGSFNTAVFGAGGTLAHTGSSLTVVSSFGANDDKILDGMTFNPVSFQTIASFSGTWAANSNVVSVSSVTNLHAGEAISGTGIPANSVILSVNTVNNQVTISQVTSGSGSGALTTQSGYILSSNRYLIAGQQGTTITLGAGTDTIFDNNDSAAVGGTPALAGTATSVDSLVFFNTNYGNAAHTSNALNLGSVIFTGSGTLSTAGFNGTNATLSSGFTGTVIVDGLNAQNATLNTSIMVSGGTAIFAKTGTGNAVSGALTINGGTVVLGGNSTDTSQLGTTTTLTLSSGELDLNNNYNNNVAFLTDGGSALGVIDNKVPGTSGTLTVTGTNGNNTFAGVIKSSVGTTNIGITGGTLVLPNSSPFSGNLIVSGTTSTSIIGGHLILPGSGSAPNAVAQIFNGGVVTLDDTVNSNVTTTRFGGVTLGSNSPTGADGLQVLGNSNSVDKIGVASVFTQSNTANSATGVATYNFGLSANFPYTLEASSMNNGANGIGVVSINDGFGGLNLGFNVVFLSDSAPTSIGGVVPWAYAPNGGILAYDPTFGFELPSATETAFFLDGQTNSPGADFNAQLGSVSITSTIYNSIYNNSGAGTITIANNGNLTVTSGAIAANDAGSITISGGTLTLPHTGYIYGGAGSVITIASDINSSNNIRLAQVDGSPNANFILAAPSPDFTGTLYWGGTNGGPTLTLSDVNALEKATLSTDIGGGRLILTPNVNATVHMLYNVGAIEGAGGMTVSGGASTSYINTLAVGANGATTTFSGQLVEQGGGGISADFLQKVGTGTLTLSGIADNAGLNIKLVSGGLVLNKVTTNSIHGAAQLWVTGGVATMGPNGTEQVFDGGGALIVDGGTVDLNGTIQVESGFRGAGGTVTNNGTGLATLTLRPTGNGAAYNYSGSINDGVSPISVVVGGTDSANLTLAGISNFSGPLIVYTNSTLTVLGTVSSGNLQVNNTNTTGTNLVVVGGALNVNGSFTFTSGVTSSALTNLILGGSGNMSLNGSFIGAVNTAGTMITAQTVTWAGPGTFAINNLNTPFPGSLTLNSGNLSMNGGTATNAAMVTISGVNGGLVFSNAAGGTLNRLTNVALNGSAPFITANGGSSATTDNITGTVTMGGAGQINILTNGAIETLDINMLNLKPGASLKINANALLGGNARIIIGNGTTFNVGGIIPFAVAGSGSTFLGLVTYNAANGVELATSNVTKITDGGDITHAGDIFQGSLDSSANPFNTGGKNNLPTITGALINTASTATFTLGNTLTLASGAIASQGANLTINDVSGNGSGVLNFGTLQGAIFAAGGGTVTLNAPMTGTGGLALITGSNLGTNFVISAVDHLGGYTSIGGSDTLTLSNPLALADTALNVPGPTGALVFNGFSAYTLGGLGGGLSFALTNAASAPVTLSVGSGSVNTTYAGNLTGAGGSLVKIGNTVMSVDFGQGANNWTIGSVTINGGTLSLTDVPTATNNTTINTFGPGTITINAGGDLDFNNVITTNNIYVPNNILLNGGVISEESNNVYLGLSSNNSSSATMSTIAVTAGTNGTLMTNASGMDIHLDGFLSLPSNSTLTITNSGTASSGGVWFENTASSVAGMILINGTANAGGRLILNTPAELANAAIVVSGGSSQSDFVLVNATIGSLAGTGVFVISNFSGGGQVVAEGALGSSTWGGNLTGAGTLTKIGATTTLTLTGTNSFTGTILPLAGSVDFSATGAASAATLSPAGIGNATFDGSAMTASSITRVASVNLLQNSNTIPALTVIGNSGALSTTQVVNGAINALNGLGTIDLVVGAGTGTMTLQATTLVHNLGAVNIMTDANGTLGTNALLKINNYTAGNAITLIGASATSLNGVNTAVINAPVIPYVMVNRSGFASYSTTNNSIVLAGSTNTLADGDTSGSNFNGNASTLPTFTSSTTSVTSFFNTGANASATINGVFNVASGGLASNQNMTFNGSGTITSSGQVVGATVNTNNELMVIASNASNITFNNVIGAGSASNTVNGVTFIGDAGSSITLNGADTYKGITNISDTVVYLGNNLAMQFSTYNYNSANNGTLAFTATAPVLGGLTGDAGTTLNLPANVNLSVGNNGVNTTYNGTITGSGALSKVGSGILQLANPGNDFANYTWTGGLNVSGGTLQFNNLNPNSSTFQWAPPSGTITLIGRNGTGGTLEYVAGSNSGNYYAPNVVFDGGQLMTDDGVLHVGADSQNNTYNIIVTSNGGSITPSWNNKNIVVDGLLMNGAGTPGTLVLTDRDTGGPSAVEFTNPNNTFSGTILVNETPNGGEAIAIGSGAGSSGTALQFAVINLNGQKGSGPATVVGASNTNRPTVGGSNALIFNDTTGTMQSATIGGLAGSGSFALVNTASGSLSHAINLSIVTNGTAAPAYTGNISGGGSLTIGGSGTVTMSGSNSYAGNTTLLNGVLAMGSPHLFGGTSTANPTGSLIFAGGTLQLASGVSGLGISAADDLTGRIATSGAANINIDTNGQNITWAGNIAFGNNPLVKMGVGTLALGGTSYSGTTSILRGRLELGSSTGGVNIASTGLGAELSPGTTGNGTIGGAVHAFSTGGINMIDGLIGTENISGATTLDAGSYLGFDLGAGTASDEMVLSSLLTATGPVTINLGVASGALPATTSTYTLITGSVDTVNPSNFQIGMLPSGFSVTLTASGDGHTLFANSTYSAPFNAYWSGTTSGVWNFNNNGTTNWSSDANGTPAVNSPGYFSKVTFSASNAGAGPLNTTLGTDFQVQSVTFQGSQTVTIGGANNLFLAAANGLLLMNTAGPATINTTGQLQLGIDQVWENDSSTAPLTISSVISGAHAITTQGVGTIVLNGSNLYTSGLTITNGIVQTGNVGALAAGSLTMTGGTLDIHGTAVVVGKLAGTSGVITNLGGSAAALSVALATGTTQTFGGNIVNGTSATGLAISGSGGSLVLTGAGNNFTGSFTQGAQVVQIGDGTANSGSLVANDANTGGTLSFSPVSAFSYTGAVTGSGKVQINSGHVTLNNSNSTYTGGTNVPNASTLTLGTSGVLGSNTNGVLNLGGSAFLDLNGFTQQMGTLTGSGTVTNLGTGNGIILFNPSTAATEAVASVFNDGPTGTVGVTLYNTTGNSAAGTLQLSTFNTAGQSNFSGGITVNNGVFEFGTSLPSNAIDQLTGGTVTLNGGFIYEFNTAGFDSGQYFIPHIVLNGGGVIAREGTLHLGQDASGNLYTVAVTASGSTLEATYGNKDLDIDGQLTGSGNLTVQLAWNGNFSSGVAFNNSTNTYSGTITDNVLTTNASTGNGSVIVIGDADTVGIALQFATVNLNGNLATNGTWSGGNAVSTTLNYNFSSLPNTTQVAYATTDPRYQSILNFNGTQMTSAIIAGLIGSGNIALENNNTVGDPSLNLIINTGATVNDTYTGVLMGTGSLTKQGPGTLALGGASTFTGAAIAAGGVLVVQNTAALGTAVVTSTGGSIQFSPNPAGTKGVFTFGELTGSGNLLLQDNATTGSAGINLQVDANGANSTYSGILSGLGSLTMVGVGSLLLTGANNFGGATAANGLLEFGGSSVTHQVGPVTVGAGNLTVDAGDTVVSKALKATSTGVLTIAGTYQLQQGASASGTSVISAIPTFVGSGKLDITDDKLIVQSTGATGNKASLISSLETLVNQGKNGGAWTGSGITSSVVANDVATATAHTYHTTLAIADNASLITPFTTYGGQAVNTNSILVTRALIGDGNLDNTVNNADVVVLLTHYGLNNQTQTGGDFNGDGTVNNADVVALLTDYGQALPGGYSVIPGISGGSGGTVSGGGSSAPVPEPASLAVLALGGAALLARRRRKC